MQLGKFLSGLGCIISREWRTSETFYVLDAPNFERFSFLFPVGCEAGHSDLKKELNF